ncbi:MAG: hypothetical protein QOD92_2362 [Acidimicrobiaceae bacterium]|jgi:hypothetical protein
MDKARWIMRLACVGLFVAASLVVSGGPASAAVTGIAELRLAVTEANFDSGNETINLAPSATYSISGDECEAGGEDDDANTIGDLDVFLLDESNNPQDLTIQTPSGMPAVIVVSCPLTRAIEVVSNVGDVSAAENANVGTLTLRNVIVRGGRAPDDSQPENTQPGDDDFTAGSGGGVFAPLANLAFTDVVFDDNRAGDGEDGDDNNPNGESGGFGGAVALLGGTLTATHSTFTNNGAGDGNDGFTNTCDPPYEFPAGNGGNGGSGGAIFAFAFDAPIELSVETSTFSGNSAGDGGDGGDGTPAVCNAPGFGGDGGTGGDGGAISVSQRGTTFSIGHSAFSQNAAGDGGDGGDGADGADAIQAEDLSAAATGGSGASGGFAGDGGSGGGVSNFDNVRGLQAEPTPDRVIVNSTFDSNASGNGGDGGDGGNGGAGSGTDPDGIGGDGRDGGCGGTAGAITDVPTRALCAPEPKIGTQQVEGALLLAHLTITENGNGGSGGAGGTAGTGETDGTDGADGSSAGGSISSSDLEAVGVVVGTSAEDANDCNYPEIVGGPLFVESSFSTDDSCGFGDGSVQPFATFALTAFGDHGGPTDTRVPQAGSVLLNFIAPADCSVPDDQRAVSRPQETGCEVGAVEVTPAVPETTTTTTAPGVGADELARTGRNSLPLVQIGAGLLGIGTALVLKRPYGRHYGKRAARKSRGRHFAAR